MHAAFIRVTFQVHSSLEKLGTFRLKLNLRVRLKICRLENFASLFGAPPAVGVETFWTEPPRSTEEGQEKKEGTSTTSELPAVSRRVITCSRTRSRHRRKHLRERYFQRINFHVSREPLFAENVSLKTRPLYRRTRALQETSDDSCTASMRPRPDDFPNARHSLRGNVSEFPCGVISRLFHQASI